ncbi:hypothetical protein ACHAXR_009118 [Thalassiosira sp. AJA248-18]
MPLPNNIIHARRALTPAFTMLIAVLGPFAVMISSLGRKTSGCYCRRRRWLWFYFLTVAGCCLDQIRKGYSSRQGGAAGQTEDIDDAVKVFSPTNSTSNVAICTMIKDETMYLDEWVDFHIALGFSPIIIYDNSPEFELVEGFHSGLTSWYETRADIREHIRLIHFPMLPGGWYVKPYGLMKTPHFPAMHHCMTKDAINSTFVALIDADEFFVLKKHDNVVDFVDQYCPEDCGQLSINWRIMGISGHKDYTPVPVTKRDVNWSKHRAHDELMKPFVRPTYVKDETRHYIHKVDLKKGKWLDTSGNPPDLKYQFQNRRNPTDVAVLFHYALKSAGEFHYKTCIKSRPNEDLNYRGFCNNKNKHYYSPYNGTIFDDSAWKQLKRMVPKYRRFGEAANVTYEIEYTE